MIDRFVRRDTPTIHTGTAEKTSVEIFAIPVER